VVLVEEAPEPAGLEQAEAGQLARGQQVPGQQVPEQQVPEQRVPEQRVPEQRVRGQQLAQGQLAWTPVQQARGRHGPEHLARGQPASGSPALHPKRNPTADARGSVRRMVRFVCRFRTRSVG